MGCGVLMKVTKFPCAIAMLMLALPLTRVAPARADARHNPRDKASTRGECLPMDVNSAIGLLKSTNLDVRESAAWALATPFAIRKKCFPQSLRKERYLDQDGCWYVGYDEIIDEMILDDSAFLGEVVPANIEDACPNYATMGTKDPVLRRDRRRAFWHFTMQSMAGAESGFRAAKRHQEKFRYTPKGEKVTEEYPGYSSLAPINSDGLFQVSGGSNCGSRKVPASKLRRARENIQCAIGGLERQLFEERWGMFTNRSQWAILQYQENVDAMNSCLRRIPGYKLNDASGVSAEFRNNLAGCRGLSGRRLLADFWENYPSEKIRDKAMGKELCGLKHVFEFCVQDDVKDGGDVKGDGTLRCAPLPHAPVRQRK